MSNDNIESKESMVVQVEQTTPPADQSSAQSEVQTQTQEQQFGQSSEEENKPDNTESSTNGGIKGLTGFVVSAPDDSGNKYDKSDEKSLEEQKEDLKSKRYSEDTEHRRLLVHWVMETSNVWIACVVFILILCGFGIFILSDVVLSTLLATTTATVLGLPLVVLKGLFGDNEK